MQVNQAADGSLHPGDFGSSWLLDNKELSSIDGVGWSRRLRGAEPVPKVVTGKEVGGWPEAGSRGVPGSVKQEAGPGTPRELPQEIVGSSENIQIRGD